MSDYGCSSILSQLRQSLFSHNRVTVKEEDGVTPFYTGDVRPCVSPDDGLSRNFCLGSPFRPFTDERVNTTQHTCIKDLWHTLYESLL